MVYHLYKSETGMVKLLKNSNEKKLFISWNRVFIFRVQTRLNHKNPQKTSILNAFRLKTKIQFPLFPLFPFYLRNGHFTSKLYFQGVTLKNT